MDNVSGEIYLKKLHEDIISAAQRYELPWPILSQVSEEYLGYLRNKDGNSFYYQWLALLVKIIRPKQVLELGSSYGLSTLMILSELSDTASLTSCDVVKQLDFIPPHIFNDARLKLYFGDDLNLNIFGNDLPVGIDMLFIDTDHTFAQVSAEWKIYKHLCDPGAIVILDDIRMNDMFDFWDSLQYPKLELSRKCHSSGFGFFLYTEEKPPDPLIAYREALQNAFEQSCFMKDKQMGEKTLTSSIFKKFVRIIRLQ